MRIGVDLGGTKIEVVVLDADRELLRRRVATPARDYDGTIGAIARLVAAAEADVGERCSVGVGTPGSTSPVTGLIRNANSTVLNGRPLEADLAAALERPVRLANDADCLALSEAADGAGRGLPVVFAAILGTGVGGGLVVDGRLNRGRNGIAGEWGHTPLPWPRDNERPGPACYCGKYGCLETFLSGPALARDHLLATGEDIAAPGIAAAAAAGQPGARATIERYRDRLARGLAVVVCIVDPGVVVFGGGVSNAPGMLDGLAELVLRYAFTDALATPFVRAAHGDSSGVRGAARLWPLAVPASPRAKTSNEPTERGNEQT